MLSSSAQCKDTGEGCSTPNTIFDQIVIKTPSSIYLKGTSTTTKNGKTNLRGVNRDTRQAGHSTWMADLGIHAKKKNGNMLANSCRCVHMTPPGHVKLKPKFFNHKLNVDPHLTLVQQKQHQMAPFKAQVIKEELNKLLVANFFREVHYPT